MKTLRFFTLATVLLCLCIGCGKVSETPTFNIIPEPVFSVQKEGIYMLKSSAKIYYENLEQNSATAKYVDQQLRKMHFSPAVSDNTEKSAIHFLLNAEANPAIGDEGYVMEITESGVLIAANTETGLFYGFQTLLQMLPTDISNVKYSKVALQFCSIQDYPAYTWRGSHMDVCRHFFDVDQVKKHLDVMAAYKMNRFHWHLTEDQGWRIEIDKYPLLTKIGAWRVDHNDLDWCSEEAMAGPKEGEKCDYGGYYTKDEIREVVAYAKERHIEIIPEIEFPGHSSAILAAYPHLGCDDSVKFVPPADYWPPYNILCGGNDSVLTFLRDVFDEVVELFPFEYIHVGGDEALKNKWQRCPKCQARIKELKLKNEEELQGWMTAEMEKYLNSKGKRIIGWDEILEGFVTPSCTVMSWRGTKGGIVAAQKGNDVIMTPTQFCYFDYRQGDSLYQPQAIGRRRTFLPLAQVYKFNPTPEEIPAEFRSHILGGQCNLWAEYIKTPEHQQYLLLPRLCAMSECLWSPQEKKDWEHFRTKIEEHKTRLHQMGYNVCPGSFMPTVTVTDNADGKLSVSLESEELGTYFHYTTDGKEPTTDSPVYSDEKPLVLEPGSVVKTLAEYRDKTREGVYTFHIDTVGTVKPE